MKAEDLRFAELIHFREGLIQIASHRLFLQNAQVLGQLQRDLMQMLGTEQARRILTRYGYFWGQCDASVLHGIMSWDSPDEAVRACAGLLNMQGVGTVRFDIREFDVSRGVLDATCTCSQSGFADAYRLAMSTAGEPVCWLLSGYFSGYCSYVMGKSVYFIEAECAAVSGAECSFIGRDCDSWGNEVEPYIDYFYIADIQGTIEKYLENIEEYKQKLSLQKVLLDRALTGSSIGNVTLKSLEYHQVIQLADRVAPFDSSVLITGETGVGKDMLARHIHALSPRSRGPFVAVNCTSLTDTLLESELFGHRAGSFTGATRDKRGLFEEAQGGVIFLDEIGDISSAMQMKLLRVLQEREILRVGDTKPIRVDFRLVSATNRDIEGAVKSGTFREDLFYRLQVIHIMLPPLRERREDILPLARYFVEKQAVRLNKAGLALDTSCIEHLLTYSWPGNIRELENAVEHAAVMCPEKVILPEHFPVKIIQRPSGGRATAKTSLTLEEIELQHINKVLAITGGNREEAARILNIGVATLYRRLSKMKQP